MSNKISFVFTGDIGFDKYMNGKWKDEELISEEVLGFLKSGDHVVANIEGPLSNADKNFLPGSVEGLMHTMDPQVTRVLKKMNADIWNLNNNHIMDAGEQGVKDTLHEAEKFGAMTVGAGMNIDQASKPLVFKEAGGIGIFAVGYRRGCKPAGEDHAGCLLWNEMELIQRNIDEIKKQSRWCVIISHGGEEFTSLPSPYTRDRYLKYLEMGADIVVCHHPHVPMNYELVGDNGEKAVFYSLGNFIFDTDYQRAQYNTEKGILLRLDLNENDFSFKAFGIRVNRENEHIEAGELPKIFRNVGQEDYRLLAPLAAKMFVAATKRQQIFLNPERFKNASDEEWKEHFANPKRSGRVEGEALDFRIVCPLAEKESAGEWKKSRLEDVKEYILDQMQ